MSGPVRETLDETIDRVAATLTAVPADPGFTERLASRLTGRSHAWPNSWLLAGAAAAAALVIAVLASSGRNAGMHTPQDTIAASAPAAPALVEHLAAPVAEAPPIEQTSAPVDRAPAVVESEDGDLARPPAIAALAAPDGIGVATLQLEALYVTPVDIGQIDIASLEVREIDGFEEPKE